MTAFTRALWAEGSERTTPFPGNGTAAVVFDSIWNIEETYDGQYVVRDADLARYVLWLTEGDHAPGLARIAWVYGVPAELATRVGVPTVRFWVDGIGWHESMSFASPYSGRCFVTDAPLRAVVNEPTIDVLAYDPLDSSVLSDLFDTLCIDMADLFQPPAVAVRKWRLWSKDDNGVCAQVSSFTGRAKALAELQRFESLGHKQTYWVDEADAASSGF